MKRFVWWHTYVNLHSRPLMDAMVRRGMEVVWMASQATISDRKGVWDTPDLPGIKLVVSPSESQIEEELARLPSETIHLFQGFRGHRLSDEILPRAISRDLITGVFAENRPSQGQWSRSWKSKIPFLAQLRKAKYRQESAKFNEGLKFVLSAGYTGPVGGRAYYTSSGIKEELLYPALYPLDPPTNLPPPDKSGPFQMVYVGQCIPRKAGDVMLQALARVSNVEWRLKLIGEGEERANWTALASSLDIGDRVDFMGAVPLAQTHDEIARSDLLLLPSHFDAWGQVTVEALTRGVPTICTDTCGSRDLVQVDWRGCSVPAADPGAMALAIDRQMAKGKNSEAERIWRWSECIGSDAFSDYVLHVVASAVKGTPRPEPVWLT
ncbi:MAG TPA: glycosyltransferase family 4 protein [Fimbriimonas sp.]|nr:glycosyltransferase family 4 protein [Fimbriimonas sp.]